METSQLREAFKQAAEIASVVPENLQEAAFQRALDALLGPSEGSERSEDAGGEGEERRHESAESSKHPRPEHDLADLLVQELDATKYPDIRTADQVLDRALGLLHAARVDHNIDGLTPQEIAKVLTDKFRIATPDTSVSDALGKRTGDLVDRVREGRGYRYRIMASGEEYLTGASSTEVATKSKKTRRKKSGGSSKKETTPQARKVTASKSRTGRSRPGPKQLLEALIEEGFFDQARIISDIAGHISDTRGRTYKSTDLSPTLVRLLREKKLSRSKNSDGQYEYVA